MAQYQTITGTIAAISGPKPDTNRWGKSYIKVSFKMDDDNWYGLFINDTTDKDLTDIGQSVSVGDYVTIEYELNDKGFRNVKAMSYVPVTEQGSRPDEVVGAVAAAKSKYNEKEIRITAATAQKCATQLVCALITSDHLSLGKKADAVDNAVGYVDALTARFAKSIDTFQFTEEEQEESADGPTE